MSLYNEVRPMKLSEVVGQKKIVEQIRGIIHSGNIPNVCLFVGPRGTGKTSVARIFARTINCEHPGEDGPCGECLACSHDNVDVIELDAASHNKVDDVHRIIDDSVYAPTSKFKIYIIDEVHMLSTAAFNALLKLLEEPPSYCRFILCTTEEHKVPVTIISRCRRFYFERIDMFSVVGKLKSICDSRHVSYTDDALYMIAKKSEGCMRDAESLLEVFLDAGKVDTDNVSEVIGYANEEYIFGILSGVTSGNASRAFDILDECVNKGKDLMVLVRSIVEALTDVIYYLQSSDTVQISATDVYKELLVAFSGTLDVAEALEIVDSFSDVYLVCLKGGSPDFIIKAKILSLINHFSQKSSTESRLKALEEECEALKNTFFDLASDNGLKESDSAGFTKSASVDEVIAGEEVQVKGELPLQVNDTVSEESTEQKTYGGFFDIPTFDSELPGDITLPAGTQIMGMLSIDEALSDGLSNCPNSFDSQTASDEAPAESNHTSECTSKESDIDFSNTGDIPIMEMLAGLL